MGQIFKPFRGLQPNLTSLLSKGCVSFFSLNEFSGNISGESMRGKNGVLTNSPTWASGGVNFVAASSQHVLGSNKILIDSFPITMIVWFRTTTTGASRDPFSIGDLASFSRVVGISLTAAASNMYPAAIVNNSGLTTVQLNTNVADGKWHMVAATFETDRLSILLDGHDFVESTGLSITIPIINDFIIGARVRFSIINYFDGDILNASIYNRVLSASEIQSLYKQPYGMFAQVESKYRVTGGGTIYDMSATGEIGVEGSAGISAFIPLSGAGEIAVEGAASVTNLISLLASGEIAVAGAAAIVAIIGLSADGEIEVAGTGLLNGIFGLSADGEIGVEGQAFLNAIQVMAATGEIAVEGSANLTFVGVDQFDNVIFYTVTKKGDILETARKTDILRSVNKKPDILPTVIEKGH